VLLKGERAMLKKTSSVYDSVGIRLQLEPVIKNPVDKTATARENHGALVQPGKLASQPSSDGTYSARDGGYTKIKDSHEKSGRGTGIKRMLVVDSSAPVFFAYRVQFERQGVIIDACETYKEAIELLNLRNNYDVALIDVCQSEVCGENNLELTSILRERRADVKIILLTGSSNGDAKKKAEDAAASFYFEKPVLSSTIFWALKKLGIIK
jgi:CheY-like chemotaxis protein